MFLEARGDLGYANSDAPAFAAVITVMSAGAIASAKHADANAGAARQLYYWWVPRSFDLARQSGRRTRARNLRTFRRMCELHVQRGPYKRAPKIRSRQAPSPERRPRDGSPQRAPPAPRTRGIEIRRGRGRVRQDSRQVSKRLGRSGNQ